MENFPAKGRKSFAYGISAKVTEMCPAVQTKQVPAGSYPPAKFGMLILSFATSK